MLRKESALVEILCRFSVVCWEAKKPLARLGRQVILRFQHLRYLNHELDQWVLVSARMLVSAPLEVGQMLLGRPCVSLERMQVD